MTGACVRKSAISRLVEPRKVLLPQCIAEPYQRNLSETLSDPFREFRLLPQKAPKRIRQAAPAKECRLKALYRSTTRLEILLGSGRVLALARAKGSQRGFIQNFNAALPMQADQVAAAEA